MFRYACSVLDRLRDAGYNTYRLRKEKILSESTIQKLREGKLISLDQIGVICDLLACQPWDLIEYLPGVGDSENGNGAG